MKKVLLAVLDGWGIGKPSKGNAIFLAEPLHMRDYWRHYPHAELNASGEYVGLVKGNMGNSEVGHLHLGAGRLVRQDLVRINNSIKDKSFFHNPVLVKAMKHSKTLHLLGLISDAGVHSHLNHLFALLDMAKQHNVKQVYVHAITDGRDTLPKSAHTFIERIEKKLFECNPHWKIATVIGRYYAMDRDNRWHREHKAYDAMVNCKGYHYSTADEAVHAAYSRGEGDEFIKPSIAGGKVCNVKEGDSVIFFNFRSDRAREITRAFVQGKFNKFKRKKLFNLNFACLTQYDPEIKAPVAFPPEILKDTLGEVIAKKGFRQFRLAETEKWAHVTYFFNGLSGKIFSKEERLLIPSPKVKTYDTVPEMSAYKVADAAKKALSSKKYSFVLVNFANPDMVGHTGMIPETIKAIRAADECLGKIVETARKNGYSVIITADHGNAEQKRYSDGSICTAHTTNRVPLIIIDDDVKELKRVQSAGLYNVAPTILKLLGIKQPKEMRAKALI